MQKKQKRNATPIPLSTFLRICGMKADQVAGFSYWSKKQNLGPLTAQEWQGEYQKFMGKPTR